MACSIDAETWDTDCDDYYGLERTLEFRKDCFVISTGLTESIYPYSEIIIENYSDHVSLDLYWKIASVANTVVPTDCEELQQLQTRSEFMQRLDSFKTQNKN